MAHDHSHTQADTGHYLDQLCTLGVSAGLGIICVVLWWRGALAGILADFFQQAVLGGGLVLLVVVLVRAVLLWQEVGPARSVGCTEHGHEHPPSPALPGGHVHAPEHDHDPERDHDHEHEHPPSPAPPAGHEHAHGWQPIRYVVLLVPIALFFLGLPNQDFASYYMKLLEHQATENSNIFQRPADLGLVKVPVQGDEVLHLDFRELVRAAYSQQGRDFYQGRLGKVLGMVVPDRQDPKVFTLVRIKITCCFADALPLNVTVVSAESVAVPAQQWVWVTGQIQFRPRAGRSDFVPVLQLQSLRGIEPTVPPPSLYLQ
jgi:uncharacterized repeat protein (TIGR03943 family)